MVRIRSACEAIRGVSCLAAKLVGSPPRLSKTVAASGCMSEPTTALVPALEVVKFDMLRRAAYADVSRSAVGDRQIFPVQTKRRCSVEPLSYKLPEVLNRPSNASLKRHRGFPAEDAFCAPDVETISPKFP